MKRGENVGRTLTHVAVVRAMQTLGTLEKDAFVADGRLALEPAWNPRKMRAVVLAAGARREPRLRRRIGGLGFEVNVRAALAIALVFAPHISIAHSQPPAAAAAAPAVYVPAAGLRHVGPALLRLRNDARRSRRRPTSCSSASSTTIRNTHRLEAAILDGLRRRGVPVVLSLEMFERDVQPAVNAYLAGKTTEEEFLKTSRPWPRYATDYRALVEMAKAQRWPVIASNVPRRYASDVAKTGRAALDALPAADRALAAQDLVCPKDAYFERFADDDGAPSDAGIGEALGRGQARADGALLRAQCRERRDHGRGDRARHSRERPRAGRAFQRSVPQRFRPRHRRAAAPTPRRPAHRRRVDPADCREEIDTVSPSAEILRRGDYLLYALK